ncbi:MAG TPA: bifunctional [glutamine synthetase] adenylyltransferase/[glutamine synthetase]-adenylyl-L-tyrosine phosphorylase [Mycobacteriales bacterium]|nr:bifunctional [glutamine synthetase] adenylyltransferase/[glutamine synthetase]-adenylyl-L-tyrosine phosphorylase [Mycobacteriales bacterium]
MASEDSAGDARLTRLGFTDPQAARAVLGPDGLQLWSTDGAVDAGASEILTALAQVADPDLALGALGRLVDVVPKPAVLLAALRSSAGLRARLLGVLGTSTVLGDHLVRHPRSWPTLADDRITLSRPSALGLREQLLTAVGADVSEPLPWGDGAPRAAGAGDDVLDALRTAYRSALLRLAARDVAGGVAVDDVAAELADLAAATLDAALAIAAAALEPDVEPCRIAVIGMGKCGGRELNYVSDVDVVFVAEALPGGNEAAALRTATRLAEGLIRACSTATREGTIWPVDAGLRPEGRSGPLVRTLASHAAYYQRWAKNWEFQALLKARPVAGDLALGHAYLQVIAPMVWSQAPRPDLVADVQAMKKRVEGSVAPRESERQLKLAPGGLRDVEFSVQLLQLVHGRADERLRVRSTLEGLERLAEGGYVAGEDADRLADAYRFLRGVEHRLQLQRLRRTHTLPTEAAALRWLARSMGFRDSADRTATEGLLAERAGHAVEVRRLHEKLFYRPLLTAVSRLPADAIRLAPEAASERLEALGFADPAGALRHLEAMTGGLSRRALVLRTMLPVMLPWFAAAHDPDSGLLAFRTVSDSLGRSPWFLALLRDSEVVAERLASLLSASKFVADLLGRAPEAVALVARDAELVPRPAAALHEEFGAVVARHDDAETAAAAVRGLRRHELLRIACADLLGLLDVDQVGAALSDVSDATLTATLAVAQRHVARNRDGALDVRLVVVGMGRLGGREQGYGSDADVLFVHEPLVGADEAAAAATAKQVAEELRRLLAVPAPDPPLVVDADLRPEGRQGALTLSLSGYARYYARRAAVWEAQALLRARVIAGDADLARRFCDLIAPVRWPEAFGDEGVTEVRRIKARVETERLPRGVDRHRHIKLGPGAVADVEWTVQLLQLRHAYAVPSLQTASTLEAVQAAAAAGLLTDDDAAVLCEGWRAATAARNALTLVRGRQHDVLPDDARTLAGVARAVGYPAGSRVDFLDGYRRATRRARVVVERVFYA